MKKLLAILGLLGAGLVLGSTFSAAAFVLFVGDSSRGVSFHDPAAERPQLAGTAPASTSGPVVDFGDFTFSGPYTHENSTVYLIHGVETAKDRAFLTLQEALERELVVIHETGQVGQLSVENRSAEETVFIQAGDIVKGGKQDRALQYDLLLPPGAGAVPLASFCVEQGRWSPRGKENSKRFEVSSAQLATKELKLAARYGKNQGGVWAKVAEAQKDLGSSVGGNVQSSESGSSLQLTLESPKVQAAAERYCGALAAIVDARPDTIGYAFAVNGQVNSAEVYGSSALFRKLWPKLLKASAVEAVAGRSKAKAAPVAVHAVRAFLADAESGAASTQTVGTSVEVIMQETDRSLLFETRQGPKPTAWVHRTYLAR